MSMAGGCGALILLPIGIIVILIAVALIADGFGLWK